MRTIAFLVFLATLALHVLAQIQQPIPAASPRLRAFDTYTSGSYGDVLFIGCRSFTNSGASILLKREGNGIYTTAKQDVIQNLGGGSYCAESSIDSEYNTNGRIFHQSSQVIPDGRKTAFFMLDDNYNPINVYESLISFRTIKYLGEYSVYGQITHSVNNQPITDYGIVEYKDGNWTQYFTEISNDMGTDGDVKMVKMIDDNQVGVYALQSDQTWAAVAKPNAVDTFVDYETKYAPYVLSYEYDTLVYASTTNIQSTTGTLYLSQKVGDSWTVMGQINAYDTPLRNPYFAKAGLAWADGLLWLQNDILLVYSDSFPTTYNIDTGVMIAGSAIVLTKDNNGEWKFGGALALDLMTRNTSEQVMYVRRTMSDIIMITDQHVYSYPVCFSNEISVTCNQNTKLDLCDPNNPPSSVDDAFSYTDDGCGEPQVVVQNFGVSGTEGTASLRFERLGIKVGECTAKFTCPAVGTPGNPGTPSTKAKSAGHIQTVTALGLIGSIIALL